MTQEELSARTGLTEQSIIRIIGEDQPIMYELAARLELVTGVAASFLNNLEMQYRKQIAQLGL